MNVNYWIIIKVCTCTLLMPANFYALWVILMPTDLRHQCHASRTISHAWFTNQEELFTINNKNSIQFLWKYSKSMLKVDLVLIDLNCCLWNTFGSAQRSVEQLWTFSTTSRSQLKIDSNILKSLWLVQNLQSWDKVKISHIWLEKSWLV